MYFIALFITGKFACRKRIYSSFEKLTWLIQEWEWPPPTVQLWFNSGQQDERKGTDAFTSTLISKLSFSIVSSQIFPLQFLSS